MKVRNGFVSNSSSSSFIIYGVNTEFSTVAERLEEVYEVLGIEITPEHIEHDYNKLMNNHDFYDTHLSDHVEFVADYENDDLYIGLIPSLSLQTLVNGAFTQEQVDRVKKLDFLGQVCMHEGTMYC